jgi:hypothetical protein
MINLTHEVEREKPMRHPVGMTYQWCATSPGTNANLLDSPAEWVSPNPEAPDGYDYRRNPPPADGRKVILTDTDHLWGIGGNVGWVWKSFLRGLNPIFMDPYDGRVLSEGVSVLRARTVAIALSEVADPSSATIGFELRAVGLNAPAAEYGGVSIGRTQVVAMALSGALAGLGGVNFVLGYKHYFELGFSAGAGFLGIAVALLGRNHPVGVVVAALFFGALSYGGLVINQQVPKELVEVLQALVILLAISAQVLVQRLARRMR